MYCLNIPRQKQDTETHTHTHTHTNKQAYQRIQNQTDLCFA